MMVNLVNMKKKYKSLITFIISLTLGLLFSGRWEFLDAITGITIGVSFVLTIDYFANNK